MSTTTPGRDEQRLAELGYSQDLNRAWSGFSNFAISFTIISILAGCFTTYGQAWNNGGPIAISIGWPLISCMILLVAFCMSELVSAYPTAGGIYWWASELGGAAWGWFTGWFNLVGLVAVVASVDYGCATFISALLNLWSVDLGVVNFADGASLGDVFIVFAARARAARARQHLLVAPRRAVQQRLGLVARGRRRGDPRDPDRRARQPPELLVRVHRDDQQLGLRRAACSGSTCCRSASC